MQMISGRVRAACVISFLLFIASALPAKNVRRLTLRDLNGHKARLIDYQGRVVVLNFWATWCGPCKEELPRLGKMADQYAGQNVAFVLASIDTPKKLEAVRDFAANISLPVWVGADVELLEQLSGTNVVPATLVIDEKGEIVRAINGEARNEDIQAALDWLLNGRKGPIPAERVKRY